MKSKTFTPPGTAILTGVAAAFLCLAGCSDSSDPDATTEDKLKSPFGILAVDEGNGTVTLYWNGNNFESDFDGYNIYGAKLSEISSLIDGTKIKKGKPLQLLDSEGSPDNEAKAFLEAMSYNVDSPFEQRGAKSEDTKDFQFFPIQSAKEVYPTCRPKETTESVCEALTATEETHTERGFAGTTSYSVTGLTVGTEYCFVILSSMGAGKTVSPTSAALTCVIPKHFASVTYTVSKGNHQEVDIETQRAACTGTSDCFTGISTTTGSSSCSTAVEKLCVERFNSSSITDNQFHLTPGANSAIKLLGTLDNGFKSQVDLTTESVTKFGNGTTNINAKFVNPGYIPPNQSVMVLAGQLYSLVTRVTVDTEEQYYYDFIYVKSKSDKEDGGDNTIELEFLLSKGTGANSTTSQ